MLKKTLVNQVLKSLSSDYPDAVVFGQVLIFSADDHVLKSISLNFKSRACDVHLCAIPVICTWHWESLGYSCSAVRGVRFENVGFDDFLTKLKVSVQSFVSSLASLPGGWKLLEQADGWRKEGRLATRSGVDYAYLAVLLKEYGLAGDFISYVESSDLPLDDDIAIRFESLREQLETSEEAAYEYVSQMELKSKERFLSLVEMRSASHNGV